MKTECLSCHLPNLSNQAESFCSYGCEFYAHLFGKQKYRLLIFMLLGCVAFLGLLLLASPLAPKYLAFPVNILRLCLALLILLVFSVRYFKYTIMLLSHGKWLAPEVFILLAFIGDWTYSVWVSFF